MIKAVIFDMFETLITLFESQKTGKRPLANISVGGVKKCPYYPAFSYRFIEMDKSIEENIINLFEEVEQILF